MWSSCSPSTATATASSPARPTGRKRAESDSSEDEADLFFSSGAADSSFAISLQQGATPSPKKKQKRESLDPLPKKFRARDSGVVLTDSEEELDLPLEFSKNYLLVAMPRASTSVSTVGSDDNGLVTPGVGPSAESGWPTVVNLDDDHLSATNPVRMSMGRSVDAFILKTLAAGGSVAARTDAEPKRVPGTPVKRVKTSHLAGGVQRPWQSAVAHKIGFKDFDDGSVGHGKGKAKPRKSLPAAFPGLGRAKENSAVRKGGHDGAEREAEVDLDEAESPTVRRDVKYDGLGLGRPTTGIPQFARPTGDGRVAKAPWLMRRSSSGAFSSSSDASSINATPTRLTPKGTFQPSAYMRPSHTSRQGEWPLPLPRVPAPASPLKQSVQPSSRSTSGSSSTVTTATNSPTAPTIRKPLDTLAPRERRASQNLPALRTPAHGLFAAMHGQRPHTHAHPARQAHPQVPVRTSRLPAPSDEEQPGRFEREFVEIDELGSGEFGRAMKVRYKDSGRGDNVFAVKKSKRFEGVKHR